MPARKITIEGFLSEFEQRHRMMSDRPFCWILGSGASIQSGIPTGGEMVGRWLKQLHEQEDFERRPIKEWATAYNLDIPGFDYANAAAFYPWVYQRRYRDYRDQGYAFLEDAMDHAEPSFGYSVLAQIMGTTRHKVAITTNFDNLVPDALSIYTDVSPLVCGHESLTGYVRSNLRRPLVAKIHRDLLLKPLSEPGEVEKLPDEWKVALGTILENFTPIVIGYGGNDGSLMTFLEEAKLILGGIFWCYRGHEPDERIQKVVERHKGRLVPIAGFDEVMLQIWQRLKLPDPRPALEKGHRDRVSEWQKQFEELNAALKATAESAAAESARAPVRKAAAAAVERLTKEKDWWGWQLQARAESDPEKKEALYREALEEFPSSADLIGHVANFMTDIRQKHDEAERLYRRALELDPNSEMSVGNFAVFMDDVRKDYNEAERLYRRALELDPKSASHTGNFAVFMEEIRKDYDEAERFYRRAFELDPQNANHIGNFAIFMHEVRKDYDEAERFYRRALELDTKNATVIAKFAKFLESVRKDYHGAERFYQQALELGSNDKWIRNRYSEFRKKHRS